MSVNLSKLNPSVVNLIAEAPGLTPPQRIFLCGLAESKGKITHACHSAGVSVRTYNSWLVQSPDFAEAVLNAKLLWAEQFEQKAQEMALEGNEKMLDKLLDAYMPEKFGKKVKLEGSVVHSWAELVKKADAEEVKALAVPESEGVGQSPVV